MTSEYGTQTVPVRLQRTSRIVRHRWIFLPVILAWLLASATVPAKAQMYLENVGVPPFTTKIPVENGFINAASCNLHLEIPLGSFPQRGGGADKAALVYDSAFWFLDYSYGGWTPFNINQAFGYGPYSTGGWRLVTSGDSGGFNYGEVDSGYCRIEDDYSIANYTPWIYIGPDGTSHSFPGTTREGLWSNCPVTGTPNASGYASDGSGYFISITNYTSATVYAPDGTIVGGGKKDPNGNCTA